MLLIVDYYSSLLEGSEDYHVEGPAADDVDCYYYYVLAVDEAVVPV